MKKIIKNVLCVALTVSMMVLVSACTLLEDGPAKENYNGNSTPSASKKNESFGLNETAVFENLKITATEVKESKGESFFKPESGNIFVGVNFTIENISDEEQTISSILLFDGYVDDINCELSISASAAFGSKMLDGTLAPGKKLVGWYAVEIPENWKTLELNVQSEWLSSTSANFVFNK